MESLCKVVYYGLTERSYNFKVDCYDTWGWAGLPPVVIMPLGKIRAPPEKFCSEESFGLGVCDIVNPKPSTLNPKP